MKKEQMPGPGKLSAPDPFSQEEEKEISEGDLARISEENEHRRTEVFRTTMSIGMNVLVAFFFLALLVAFLVMGAHYVLPTSKAWLTESQLDVLKTFILSCSLLGNLATATVQHRAFRAGK